MPFDIMDTGTSRTYFDKMKKSLTLNIDQAEVRFKIVPNLISGQRVTYRIIENPKEEYEMIRTPFDSIEEARQRELEIADFWGFKAVEEK